MDRILLYRKYRANESIVSPNKDIPTLLKRTHGICQKMGCDSSDSIHFDQLLSSLLPMNPLLLSSSEYSRDELDRLQKYSEFCNNLYHDKKNMMIQVHIVGCYHIAFRCHYSKSFMESSPAGWYESYWTTKEWDWYNEMFLSGICFSSTAKCRRFSFLYH